jgi:hypothetical protein
LQPLPIDAPTPPRKLSFAPRYGEHTVRILGEIGLADGEIVDVLQQGVGFAAESAD